MKYLDLKLILAKTEATVGKNNPGKAQNGGNATPRAEEATGTSAEIRGDFGEETAVQREKAKKRGGRRGKEKKLVKERKDALFKESRRRLAGQHEGVV